MTGFGWDSSAGLSNRSIGGPPARVGQGPSVLEGALGVPSWRSGPYTAPMHEEQPDQFEAATPDPGAVDLEALLVRIANRDEAALAAFYDATVSRAYAVARRFTQESWAAEDVVAEVYLQVWQQAERYDVGRGSVWAWLLMMCRSRALDLLRRRDQADLNAAPDSLREELSSSEGPLDLLETLDRRERVHAALAELEPVERQLLALAFFRGLTHQEIADQTGMPLGSAKTVLRRAMQRLKGLLEGLASGSGELNDAN